MKNNRMRIYKMRRIILNLILYCLRSIIILFVLTSILQAQVLNEIMFNPSEDNSEFIEIFNNSNMEIDLHGYKILYYTLPEDSLISYNGDYILSPGQYAVVLESDYDLETGIYSNMIPDTSKIFFIDDNAFGSSGMSNSSNRSVALLNSFNDTVDTHTYTANNKKGYSDERVLDSSDVWNNSEMLNGTPGFINSVSPLLYDLSITEFSVNKPLLVFEEQMDFKLIIKNLGTRKSENTSIMITSENVEIYSRKLSPLANGDSIIVEFNYSSFEIGKHNVEAKIIYNLDQDTTNNISELEIEIFDQPNYSAGDIVINEFMCSPETPEPEWVELFNRSDKDIDISNIKIADSKDTVNLKIDNLSIEANHYLVVADDSSFFDIYTGLKNVVIQNIPTLNNSADEIRLLDKFDNIIDSINYNQSWINKGFSTERIDPFGLSNDPNNWESTQLNTPGRINSISQKEFDVMVDSVFITKPEIVGDTVFISSIVKNIGKNNFQFIIKLFQIENNNTNILLEQSNEQNLNIGEYLIHNFNHPIEITTDSLQLLVKITTIDDDVTNNEFKFTIYPSFPRNSLVINEIMYSPINGEPEWVEIYNCSDYTIDMINWNISDVLTNPISKRINSSQKILPNEYLVISKDSSILYYHDYLKSKLRILQFANLNNTEDGVVLKDINGFTMDSVRYSSDWGGSRGSSLERISCDLESNNFTNWLESIDIEGSTPGRINSNARKDYDIAIKSINTYPQFPVKGDSVEIIIKIMNYGESDIEQFTLNIYLGLGNEAYQLHEVIQGLSIKANDSLIVSSEKPITVDNNLMIRVTAIHENDEDLVNNTLELEIIPGFNTNSVLISEIMFNNKENYSQWIELFNNTDSTINLKNWKIKDNIESKIITMNDYFIPSNEYLVIYGGEYNEIQTQPELLIETSLPFFNITQDVVVLKDFRDATIDSMFYDPEQKLTSTSIERISFVKSSTDELNWVYSLDETGNTMGRRNVPENISESSFGDVIITEIMFDPDKNNSEFIELYNVSGSKINLGAWKILYNEKYYTISNTSLNFSEGQYFTVAVDSSIYQNYNWLKGNNNTSFLNRALNLSNKEGNFYLVDIFGKVVDSIYYNENWHNPSLLSTKNTSLELINVEADRRNKNNWSSSVANEGATPSKENSINIKNVATRNKLKITPNPFSPDNDGHEDFTTISFNLKHPVSEIRVKIFDSKGRLVRDLVKYQLTGSNGSIIFDGRNNNGRFLRVGIYIVLFEAVGIDNSIVDKIKDVVVIGKKF